MALNFGVDKGLFPEQAPVSLNQPNEDQKLFSVVFTTDGTNVQTAYTVPAGRKLYLTACTHNIGAAAGAVAIYKTDGATKVCEYSQSANYSPLIAPPTPIAIYLAGEFVKVKASAGNLTLLGYEV